MPLLRAALSWNFVLATAICASLLAQLIKVLLNLFIFHRFIAERMWGAGGMPSSHSATVCAMVVATGRYCGVNSPLFAIAAVLSIIVMYDAMGVRYETGEQAKVLNRMFTEWMDQGFEQFQLPHGKKLKEMVGHTPIEVVTGAALGIVPGEIKNLPASDMPALCEEIRQFLIKSVSETGGHLSSNLGVVELTVALHRVLDFPQDKLLFDVGHQCYTHKLLTGRREGFAQLRRKNGISGFPSPRESDCDPFIAGHGSAALSTAIGIAHRPEVLPRQGPHGDDARAHPRGR